MWRWQSSQHRVGLERAMIDQTQSGIKRVSSGLVMLIPRSERGDHQAGVGRFQRRTCSRVSRTCSAVNVGNGVPATATTPLPRFSSRIGVGAISISRRLSLTRISCAWSGLKPRACRGMEAVLVEQPAGHAEDTFGHWRQGCRHREHEGRDCGVQRTDACMYSIHEVTV